MQSIVGLGLELFFSVDIMVKWCRRDGCKSEDLILATSGVRYGDTAHLLLALSDQKAKKVVYVIKEN